jgi:endonuclease-3
MPPHKKVRKPADAQARHVLAVARALAKAYPDARCGLDFNGPYPLAVATLLSAQCTDKAVNAVTPALFKKYPTIQALAKALPAEVEPCIRSLGLFRGKARHMVAMAQQVVRLHQGRVPRAMADLVALPGIGRKTGNVIRFNAFGLPGLAVDTHVLRVGLRLGLHQSSDPLKAEAQLTSALPEKDWGFLSHRLIGHGRKVCQARKPACEACPLLDLCPQIGLK